jgi:Ca-activated chloride channel family protein
MNFLYPEILCNLLWVLPLYFILLLYSTLRRRKIIKVIIGPRDPKEYVNVSFGKRNLRHVLLIFVIIFTFIAAARPYWGYQLLPYTSSGRDMLIVLDVSKSMLSRDIAPSRLDHAKFLMRELIADTLGDRYGIIAFAGRAFLECPITEDRTSLFSIINEINTSSIPVGGTNIEKAIEQAIKAFKAASGGYKAIILITDGDELQGNSAGIIDQLKDLKIPLFVVGIGNPEAPAPIQIKDEKGNLVFLRDQAGEIVKTKLNEELLKKLALATDGFYVRSTATGSGIAELEKRISAIIPEKYSSNNISRPLERFRIPLLFAVVILLFWFAIGERKEQ